jgi:hypothetical protein
LRVDDFEEGKNCVKSFVIEFFGWDLPTLTPGEAAAVMLSAVPMKVPFVLPFCFNNKIFI